MPGDALTVVAEGSGKDALGDLEEEDDEAARWLKENS